MYKPLPGVAEALDELKVRLKRERDGQRRARLHLLVLMRSGQVRSRQDAATHLAIHRNTIARWLAAYERDGLAGLLSVQSPGAKPGQKALPAAVLEALRQRLKAEGFDGYTHIERWLQEEHGLEVPYKTVHGLVRYRLGAKLKRARPVHAKKTRARRAPFQSA